MSETYERENKKENVRGVRLDFEPHFQLLDYTSRRSKTISRFRHIMINTVRTMNLQVPAEHRLWFRPFSDHIMLYERIAYDNDTSKLDRLVISVSGVNYFAPWVYDKYQRSARVLIHRKSETLNQNTYLVHRCYPNGELQHPGGHLEYIETGFKYHTSKGYYLDYETGYDYITLLVQHLLTQKSEEFKLDFEHITDSMSAWLQLGAVRETIEESGLDLVQHMDNLRLKKIGSTTFYLTIEMPRYLSINGPSQGYEREVVNYDRVLSGPLTSLDRLWIKVADPLTDHAWLTTSEMIEYWNPDYKDHVREMVDGI